LKIFLKYFVMKLISSGHWWFKLVILAILDTQWGGSWLEATPEKYFMRPHLQNNQSKVAQAVECPLCKGKALSSKANLN
jgi:cytochrome c-type biogenesis protein CcmH/NrfF